MGGSALSEGPFGSNDMRRLIEAIEKLRCLFETLDGRISSEVRRIDDLRASDLLAREVAFEAVKSVMTGFPEEYARRGDLEAIRETAVRLDRESVKREPYDQAHQTLEQRVDTKLERQVFETALTEWSTWRDGVNQRLNAQAGVSQGIARTFTWAVAAVGALGTVVGLILYFN